MVKVLINGLRDKFMLDNGKTELNKEMEFLKVLIIIDILVNGNQGNHMDMVFK